VDQFNSYGARRGNHEVMMRGTFANNRIRNRMLSGQEGGLAIHIPSGEVQPIFDVAERYARESTPLIILAGKEYGTGSSRDWAAKGPKLLGVTAVIAESYERIHRSNLVGMGILPLQFMPGENAAFLGLSGAEVFSIRNVGQAGAVPQLTVSARQESGELVEFSALVRLDTAQEVAYYRHGGILQYVLRQLAKGVEVPEMLSTGLTTGAVKLHGDLRPRNKVEEGSIESFPASDPPSY
jgi:aconitate hydratase